MVTAWKYTYIRRSHTVYASIDHDHSILLLLFAIAHPAFLLAVYFFYFFYLKFALE